MTFQEAEEVYSGAVLGQRLVRKMKPILIAGAGIGGLSAALALLQRGFDVEVYERAPVLTEVGAGLMLSANGSRLLFALGLKDEINRLAFESRERQIRLWNTGQAWNLPNQGAGSLELYGAPFLLMHRGDLHTTLANAVRAEKPDAIRLNANCVDFVQLETGVEITLESGERVSGVALIGADGLHSMVRGRLYGAEVPKFMGNVFWRGLVPIELIPKSERQSVASWFGPQGNVTFYPVRSGQLLNFVGTVRRHDWTGESWTEKGEKEECLADFRGWHRNILDIIGRIDTLYKWGLFLREPLTHWVQGRTALLGDACHPTPPSLGQGANMAIEDGVILARSLEAYADVEIALKKYEEARVERTNSIVRQSWAQRERRHHTALNDPVEAARYIADLWSADKVRTWYDWIFKYDATTVPI
jgi:salicylate hydroxylase